MQKELAKFLCGLTAWESFSHLLLWLNDSLPIILFGFTITVTINTVQIIIPAIISFLLGYFAWEK